MIGRKKKVQGKGAKGLKKACTFLKKGEAMYRGKDRSENYLFKELMPFGGKLDEGNRWIRI